MKSKNHIRQISTPFFIEDRDVLGQPKGINILQRFKHRPYWKGIHRSWLFWVFLVLMFTGIIYYIISVDFAFVPHKQMKHPSGNNRTR
jgi:hypothetical protein